VGFTITVAAGTVAELDPAPFSNTKEVIINNLSATDTVLTQVAVVYPAVPAVGAVTIANSTQIPSSSAISLCIGSEGNRNPLGTGNYWNIAPAGFGSLLNIILANLSGNPIDVNVTYVQNVGGGGQISGGC
jgi:hypothetical protein